MITYRHMHNKAHVTHVDQCSSSGSWKQADAEPLMAGLVISALSIQVNGIIKLSAI